MPKRLYVGNLPYEASDADLTTLFGQYGRVVYCKVVTDYETKRSKGFAFVELESEAATKKAVTDANGSMFGGRTIVVNEARPREVKK